MIRIRDIKVREDLSENELLKLICDKNKIKQEHVKSFRILKKAIDARNKEDIFYSYTVDILLEDESKYKRFERVNLVEDGEIKINVRRKSTLKPVIIGAGPAGLFAALTLVQNGIKPIVIEQGKTVDERQKDVDLFWQTGKLNTLSNVQFGEGGAGTFSDGKLTTGVNNPFCKKVLPKIRKTGKQTDLGYRERLKNQKNSMAVRVPDVVNGKNVLVIDDVCTTRATIIECSRALKAAGAKRVYGLTFATTVKENN